MAKRVVSKSDAELVGALRKRGVTVNARQLERYRQAGLLLEQRHEHPGRGQGTISYLQVGAVERVVEVREILTKHRDLRDALFVLFMRDREIEEDDLKEAYRAHFRDLVAYFWKLALKDPLTPPNPSSLDLTEAVARRWVRWSRRSGKGRLLRERLEEIAGAESVDGLIITLVSELFYAFLEGDLTLSVSDTVTPSHRALQRELAVGTGMSALAHDKIWNGDPLVRRVPVDAFVKELVSLNRSAMAKAINQATLAEFRVARDEFVHISKLFIDISTIADSAGERSDVAGLGTLGMMPKDEAAMAKVLPFWLVVKGGLAADGIPLRAPYDPALPESQRGAALFGLLAQLAGSTSIPMRPENIDQIVAQAPSEVQELARQFAESKALEEPK
jgi:hypothetical protein